MADLTERQRKAIRLVYYEGIEQGEARIKMSCRQDVVSRHINAAIRKIADTYEKWEELGR